MIISGSVATYTDPLTRKRTECVVMERVHRWVGTQRVGTAYTVCANGHHWTARARNLEVHGE